jgi:hypothetical protein
MHVVVANAGNHIHARCNQHVPFMDLSHDIGHGHGHGVTAFGMACGMPILMLNGKTHHMALGGDRVILNHMAQHPACQFSERKPSNDDAHHPYIVTAAL